MEQEQRGRGTEMKCESCGNKVVEGSSFCPFCFRKLSSTGSGSGTGPGPGPGPAPAPGPSVRSDEDFGAIFNRATNLWKDNLGDLVVFTLVFVLVGWIPIVNVAFFAGYVRGLMKLKRGGKPEPGEIFTAWDCFGNALVYAILFFIAMIAAGFVPFFRHLAQCAVAILATPGFYRVIERNMNAVDAVKWSFATIQRHPVPWLLAVLVGGLLGSSGMIALFVGIIITLPWGTLLIIQQYEEVRDET
jgi:hypothetical protein